MLGNSWLSPKNHGRSKVNLMVGCYHDGYGGGSNLPFRSFLNIVLFPHDSRGAIFRRDA